MRSFAVTAAALASLALAQVVVLVPSDLATNPVLWFVATASVVFALIESRIDEVTMLAWVTLTACVAPVIVAATEPDRTWNVAAAGIFVWIATELLAIGRAVGRLERDAPVDPTRRIEAVALVAAVAVAATALVALVGMAEADGGVVLAALGVVAALAYRGFARRFGAAEAGAVDRGPAGAVAVGVAEGQAGL